MYNIFKIIFTVLLITGFYGLSVLIVNAEQMEGTNNYLQIDPFSPALPYSQLPVPTTNPKDDYQIFYERSPLGTNGFRFSFSPAIIEYGELSPTDPVIRNAKLTIINKLSPSYSVFVKEDKSLKNIHNIFIPDTSCDNGACSAYIASVWNSTLSYGLGYRCDNTQGNDCDTAFSRGPQYYKQFANNARNIPDAPVMLGIRSQASKESVITLKVNIPAAQPAGTYTNTITYLALPGY